MILFALSSAQQHAAMLIQAGLIKHEYCIRGGGGGSNSGGRGRRGLTTRTEYDIDGGHNIDTIQHGAHAAVSAISLGV